MISTAAFSHRPWLETVPFDAFEDVLHSITATGMGFAFSVGVLMRLLQRKSQGRTTRVLDLLAITLAIGLPPLGGRMALDCRYYTTVVVSRRIRLVRK